MNDSVRLGRYTDRWVTGTANARRIAIAGSIFAVVILFNVLRPYVASEPARAALRDELARTEAEIATIRKELTDLATLENELDQISATVEAAPWSDLKEQLKSDFAAGQISDPRQAGNETVAAIARQVTDTVVAPLSAAAIEIDVARDHAQDVRETIETWQARYKNQPWWGTVDSKNATVQELDLELGVLQKDAKNAVKQLRSEADRNRQSLAARQKELAARETATKTEIEAALDAAVPPWAANLISVDWMIRYFAWIVVLIALYLVVTAWLASADYHGMAAASGWSNEERADPLYSSLWTLTWRGARGTAATIIVYGAVLGFLWYSVGSSLSLLSNEQVAEELRPGPGKVLLAHGLMALTLLAVVAIAFRRGGQPASGRPL